MKAIFNELNLGMLFLKKNMKEFLIDKGNFILYFFTILFYQLLFIIFIYVIFKHVPDIRGWSFYEILFIFGFFNIVSGIFYLVFAWTLWFPEKYILSGKFDILLLLPINSLLCVIYEELGRSISEIITIFLGILYIIFAYFHLKLNFSFLTLIYFLINIFSAVLVLGGIFIIFTSFSMRLKTRNPFITPFIYFMELAQYPIDIFNKTLRIILTFILPIAFAGFFPAASIIRPDKYKNFVCITFLLGVLIFYFGTLLWNLNIKKYESIGD
jgi:ABC-2 type transport system permease protein